METSTCVRNATLYVLHPSVQHSSPPCNLECCINSSIIHLHTQTAVMSKGSVSLQQERATGPQEIAAAKPQGQAPNRWVPCMRFLTWPSRLSQWTHVLNTFHWSEILTQLSCPLRSGRALLQPRLPRQQRALADMSCSYQMLLTRLPAQQTTHNVQ
jgi:hypothetical protein